MHLETYERRLRTHNEIEANIKANLAEKASMSTSMSSNNNNHDTNNAKKKNKRTATTTAAISSIQKDPTVASIDL